MGSWVASRVWVVAALLGVVVLLVGAARPWLHARSEDTVVGAATLTITGSDLSRAVPAAALLGGAALLAGLVGSPLVRRLSGACLLLAAVVAGVPILGALRDPAAAALPALEERTAITGAGEAALRVQADSTWVVYLALAGVLALALAGVLRLLPVPARPSPDAVSGGGTATPAAGAGGPRTGQAEGYGTAAWEQLSAGEDPTDVEHTEEARTDDERTDDGPAGDDRDPKDHPREDRR